MLKDILRLTFLGSLCVVLTIGCNSNSGTTELAHGDWPGGSMGGWSDEGDLDEG